MQEESRSELGSTRIPPGAVWRRTRRDETEHRATRQEAGETENHSWVLSSSGCSECLTGYINHAQQLYLSEIMRTC